MAGENTGSQEKTVTPVILDEHGKPVATPPANQNNGQQPAAGQNANGQPGEQGGNPANPQNPDNTQNQQQGNVTPDVMAQIADLNNKFEQNNRIIAGKDRQIQQLQADLAALQQNQGNGQQQQAPNTQQPAPTPVTIDQKTRETLGDIADPVANLINQNSADLEQRLLGSLEQMLQPVADKINSFGDQFAQRDDTQFQQAFNSSFQNFAAIKETPQWRALMMQKVPFSGGATVADAWEDAYEKKDMGRLQEIWLDYQANSQQQQQQQNQFQQPGQQFQQPGQGQQGQQQQQQNQQQPNVNLEPNSSAGEQANMFNGQQVDPQLYTEEQFKRQQAAFRRGDITAQQYNAYKDIYYGIQQQAS